MSVGDEMRGIKQPEITRLPHWYSGKEEMKPEGWQKRDKRQMDTAPWRMKERR